MTSLVISPLVAKKKTTTRDTDNESGNGNVIDFITFVGKPNLLEYSFSFLHGFEVARLQTLSKQLGQRSRAEYLWRDLYQNEFGKFHHAFRGHAMLSRYDKYRRAFLSFNLRQCKYYNTSSGRLRNDPLARQGSNGCIVTTIPNGVFCIVGGWTNRGLSVGLSVLREMPIKTTTTTSNGENHTHEESIYSWLDYSIENRQRENATYGHSITHIPPGVIHPTKEGMVMFGGVTMGGYRGEISSLTAIIIHPSKLSESEHQCSFSWHPVTRNGTQNGAIARSYHTCNFISSNDMARDDIHQNHVNKVYIFGGFDGNGAIADFQTAKLELHSRTNEIAVPTFDNVQPGGEPPCARFGHTCTYVKGKLYIAGGSTGSSNYKGRRDGEELQGDLYCLDLKSNSLIWSKVNFLVNNSRFEGLCRCHSAIELNGNILFSFGGGPGNVTNHLNLLYLDKLEMVTVNYSDDFKSPCARQNQSVAKLACGTRMVVFGGALALQYGSEELGDTWILDFDGDETNLNAINECDDDEHELHGEGGNNNNNNFLFGGQEMDMRQLIALARRQEFLRRLQEEGYGVEEDDDEEEDEDGRQVGNQCQQQ